MRRLFLILAFLVPLSGIAYAETQPRQGPYDARVRLATYQDGQVYRIRTSLTHVTSIEFGQGVNRHAKLTHLGG
jgi:type IV secretion system protein VirB9